MGDGTRLAVAILILFLAMVAFFFAFHPAGVELNGQPVNNPAEILQWLFGQWDATTSGGGSPAETPAVSPNTSVPSTGLTNVPGTNIGP
jgi:hypothetical protein